MRDEAGTKSVKTKLKPKAKHLVHTQSVSQNSWMAECIENLCDVMNQMSSCGHVNLITPLSVPVFFSLAALSKQFLLFIVLL